MEAFSRGGGGDGYGGRGGHERPFGDRGGRGGRGRPFGDRGGRGGHGRPFGDRGGRGGHGRPFGDRGGRGTRVRFLGDQASFPHATTSGSLSFDPTAVPDRPDPTSERRTERPKYTPRPFGFLQLKELSEKDPAQVLSTFSNETKKFSLTLEGEMKGDVLVLFVRCLVKICDAHYEAMKINILISVCKSRFIDTLQKYFMSLPYVKIVEKRNNWLYWNESEQFWEDMFKFLDCMIDHSRTTAVDCLQKLVDVIRFTLDGLRDKQDERFSPEFTERFDGVQTKFVISLQELAREKTEKLANRQASGEEEVPDDFREIPVLPSVRELNAREYKFLRPNIFDGAYVSSDHYLDVQFRLMREDYISPMRDSIVSYMKNPYLRKYDGGRFYRDVKLNHLHITQNCLGVSITFSDRIKNKKSLFRRFLFGALLCFTEDNFQSIFFGTVVERDDKMLAQGKVVVNFIDVEVTEDLFTKRFVMFESDVFYLQYGPILEVLQKFPNKVPMEDLIVKLQPSDSPPLYANQLTIQGRHVDLKNGIWPNADFGLDQYQLRAFKMALSRKFVTIQGPPGTGKTYIGLKIASTILKNMLNIHSINDPYDTDDSDRFDEYGVEIPRVKKVDPLVRPNGEYQHPVLPILVLCYTNHALDQFLEGLTETTKSIVRIGGQSKNENMASLFNLKTLRRTHRFRNPHSSELYDTLTSLKKYQSVCEVVDDDNSILDVSVFEIMLPDFDSVKNILGEYKEYNSSRSYFVNWLMMADNSDSLKLNATRNTAELQIDDDEDFDDIFDDDKKHFMDDFEFEIDVKSNLKNFNTTSLANKIKELDIIIAKNRDKDVRRLLYEKYFAQCELEYMKRNCSEPFDENTIRALDINYDQVSFGNKHPAAYNAYERWSFYKHLKSLLKPLLIHKMNELKIKYEITSKLHGESNSLRDSMILKKAHVVGVTTTAAARLRSLILSLAPKIVIIEEAAEVLESHIVVNLTHKCQHVILIGDHQQLRPSTASYLLGRKFNLEISLFERMFANDVNCYRLGVQHRMRPEISKLITPSIYEELYDHESVHRYPDVKGVYKNLFFFDHNHLEEKDEIITSYKNVFEANYIVALAKYLIQQGYKSDEITILSAYSGQLFCLREIKKQYEILNEVRINVLDNYQGEENKIILLSLVRSNEEGRIGFLEINNRVCVALSRAKEGFYIIGNMSNLMNKSNLWKTINETLKKQESIGGILQLRCQTHDIFTEITCGDDFHSKAPEGGCLTRCNSLLPCAHLCQSVCHVFFDDHANIRCLQPCTKKCENQHRCALRCSDVCQCNVQMEKVLPCGHSKTMPCFVKPNETKCTVIIQITLPLCQHQVSVECCKSKDYVACTWPCIDRLPCGHACKINCHKDKDPEHLEYKCFEKCESLNLGCSQEHKCHKLCHENCDLCTYKVKKKRDACGHSEDIQCHRDVNESPCRQNCKRTMPCGHHCKRKCYEECGGCAVPVEKPRSCGHAVNVECGRDAEQAKCRGPCRNRLACGHLCKSKCGDPCEQKKCTQGVPISFKSICGHQFQIPCNESESGIDDNRRLYLAMYCKEPCGIILKGCLHTCVGTCGSCQSRMHLPCGEACGNPLICGHTCTDPCREGCSTCHKKCEVRCSHSKCAKLCGVPCVPCNEKCERKCKHQQCSNLCGDVCNVPSCLEPCDEKLRCGHACIGVCGEPCPDVCRQCEPERLPEDIFGTEFDDETRFITLTDCKHLVKVDDMDYWVQSSAESNEIVYPQCPHCKTNVTNTARYSDQLKKIFFDIQNAKRKTFGSPAALKNELCDLLKEIESLSEDGISELFENVPLWKKVLEPIKKNKEFEKIKVNPKTKQKKNDVQLSNAEVNNIKSRVAILRELSDVMREKNASFNDNFTLFQVNFILGGLMNAGRKFSQQQADDFNSELLRLRYLIKFATARIVFNASTFKEQKYALVLDQLKDDIVFSSSAFDEDHRGKLDGKLRLISVELVAQDEMKTRKMIVAAIGLRQGHWYKCPNGHPYAIGECGGAMQVSTCPECKAPIGGTSHRLLASNRLASEMDGAEFSAYSEAATDRYLIEHGLV